MEMIIDDGNDYGTLKPLIMLVLRLSNFGF